MALDPDGAGRGEARQPPVYMATSGMLSFPSLTPPLRHNRVPKAREQDLPETLPLYGGTAPWQTCRPQLRLGE